MLLVRDPSIKSIRDFKDNHRIALPAVKVAMLTAQRMSGASDRWAPDPTTDTVLEGARGGADDGIRIHSVRMRGMVAPLM